MNRQQQHPQSLTSSLSSGLILTGTVIDRTRRQVPKNDPTTEIVTYTISDGSDRKYYVDDYAPNNYHDLGASVSFSVYIKPYVKKNGDASYNLCIQKSHRLTVNIFDFPSRP